MARQSPPADPVDDELADLMAEPEEQTPPIDRRAVRVAWARLIVATLCQTIITVVLSLCLWAAAPAAIGWQPTTVSSGSMLPRLWVGDIAVSRPLQGNPSINQVLLYDDPDHPGRLEMHRLVRIDEQGRLITKGDANPNEDSTPVTLDAIHGVRVLRIPFVGLPIVWLREGRYVPLALTLLGLGLVMAGAQLNRTLVKQLDDEESAGAGPPEEDTDPSGPEAAGRQAADRPSEPEPVDGDLVAVHRTSNATADASPAGPAPEPTATPTQPELEPVVYLKQRRWVRVVRIATMGFFVTSMLVVTSSIFSVTAAAGFAQSTGSGTTFSTAPYYSCLSAARPDSPAMYYALDETSGTVAADTSGNARNGTYSGTFTMAVASPCPSGTAVTFTGSSSLVSTPTLYSNPNTFTIEIWFRTTTTQGGRLIGFGSSQTGASNAPDRHIYMANNGALYFGLGGAGNQRTTINSTASYNDGAWHYAAAVTSSSGSVLYVDGAQVAASTSMTSGRNTSGYWRIGFENISVWSNAPATSNFAGSLDNAAVYDTALSAANVQAHYAAAG